ncbi:hypothetical protein Tco_0015185 [Tanacetum coccineum]
MEMVRWGDDGVGGVGSQWWRWLWRDDGSRVRMMMMKVACRGDDGVEEVEVAWVWMVAVVVMSNGVWRVGEAVRSG